MRRVARGGLVAALAALVMGQAPAPSPAAPPAGGAPPAGSSPNTWVPRQIAELVMLDKLRAQPTTLTVKVGQQAPYGTLTVAVKSCQSRPLDLPQNSAAFLEVTDSRGSAPVFRGWVLSATPSVAQFEHPVYDLRLVACR